MWRMRSILKRFRLIQGSSDPEKVFDRTANLENTQIINYRVDPQEKWCVLVGIAPGAPERYDLNTPPPCLDVTCSSGFLLHTYASFAGPLWSRDLCSCTRWNRSAVRHLRRMQLHSPQSRYTSACSLHAFVTEAEGGPDCTMYKHLKGCGASYQQQCATCDCVAAAPSEFWR